MPLLPLEPLSTLDLERKRCRTPTRLYPLEPLGVGTPATESLSGFIARLAEAHRVRVGTLAAWLPVNIVYGKGDLDPQGANGLHVTAQRCSEALEELTGKRNLRALTMLTWANVLPTAELLGRKLSWCPKCFEQDQTPYFRLIWSLKAVGVCSVHRVPLQAECPHCRLSSRRFTCGMRPGYCSRCGRWLGDPAQYDGLSNSDFEHDIGGLNDKLCVADLAGKLIAAAASITPPAGSPVTNALREAQQARKAPEGIHLFHTIQVTSATYHGWAKKGHKPSLPWVLDICRRLNVCPIHLLTTGSFGDMANWKQVRRTSTENRSVKVRRKRNVFDAGSIRQRLEEIMDSDVLPPPTLFQVCRELGFVHNVIWRHFPDFCAAIRERSRYFNRERGIKKRAAVGDEIRAIVKKLHDSGIEPKRGRVAKLMAQPAFLKKAELREVLNQARAELGWT